MYHINAQCLRCSEEGNAFPRIGVTNVCELPYGCGHSNLGPLQEDPVLLTTESSFPIYTSSRDYIITLLSVPCHHFT